MSLPSRKVVLPYTEKNNSKITPIDTPLKKQRVETSSNERVKRVLNTTHPIARLKQNTKQSFYFGLPAITKLKPTSQHSNASHGSFSALDFYETAKVPMSSLVHFKKDDYTGLSLNMSKQDQVLYSTIPEVYNPNTFISSSLGLRWNEFHAVTKDEQQIKFKPNIIEQHKQKFTFRIPYDPELYTISSVNNNTSSTSVKAKPFIGKVTKLEPLHKPTVFDHHWYHSYIPETHLKKSCLKPYDEVKKNHSNHLDVLVETEYAPKGALTAYPAIRGKTKFSNQHSSSDILEDRTHKTTTQSVNNFALEDKQQHQKLKQFKLERLHAHEKRIGQYIEESNLYQEKRDRGIRTTGYDAVSSETPDCW